MAALLLLAGAASQAHTPSSSTPSLPARLLMMLLTAAPTCNTMQGASGQTHVKTHELLAVLGKQSNSRYIHTVLVCSGDIYHISYIIYVDELAGHVRHAWCTPTACCTGTNRVYIKLSSSTAGPQASRQCAVLSDAHMQGMYITILHIDTNRSCCSWGL